MTKFNIASLVDDASQKYANKAAIIHFEKGAYRHYLYRELFEDSNAYALALKRKGIRRGSRVALLMKPGKDFFVFTLALFKAGLIPVFLDPAVGLKPLKQCIKDAKVDVFVGSFGVYVASFLLGWRKGKAKHVFTSSFTSLRKQSLHRTSGKPIETVVDDTAAIIFTSGSTGSPKGVVYTHENLAAQLKAIKSLYDINNKDVDLPTLPVFTFFDLAFGLTSVLANTNTLRPAKAEPEKLIEAVKKFNVTSMFASPILIEKLAHFGQANNRQILNLKRVISAGAPANPETLKLFQETLEPDVPIHTPYGATECLPITSISSRELFLTGKQTNKGAGVCLGMPAAGLDVRIIKINDELLDDWSSDLEKPQGEVGEIIVKGRQVTTQYVERPEATKLAKLKDIDGGTMHRMGDLGYFDEKGRLWFVGRKAHRVQLENETLFTIPVERIFNQHPEVKRSALVGVNLKGKLEPVVCVELNKHILNSEQGRITEDLKEMAASNKNTMQVKTFFFHPGLPVDVRHNSKIIRETLKDWVQKQLGG